MSHSELTIYVMHETMSPNSVRATLDGAEAVPPIGADIRIPGAGYMGKDARWRVTRAEWLWVVSDRALLDPSGTDRSGHWSVTVWCVDRT